MNAYINKFGIHTIPKTYFNSEGSIRALFKAS